MAKFSRFDPRNKKQGRNKERSLYKDVRIKMIEEKERRKNWTNVAWVATDDDSEEMYEDDYND